MKTSITVEKDFCVLCPVFSFGEIGTFGPAYNVFGEHHQPQDPPEFPELGVMIRPGLHPIVNISISHSNLGVKSAILR